MPRPRCPHRDDRTAMTEPAYVHPTATVDEGARLGAGTRVWHYCHVASGAVIGERCSFGQNCFVADGVTVGDGVTLSVVL